MKSTKMVENGDSRERWENVRKRLTRREKGAGIYTTRLWQGIFTYLFWRRLPFGG